MTFRAIRTLKEADVVICEEYKVGSKLLKHFEIKNDLKTLNEHNEVESLHELVSSLQEGQSLALISDCGTPVFADPGTRLVQAAVHANCPVVPVPGASSLMASLVGCGFEIKQFHYAGFLPRNQDERCHVLRGLRKLNTPLVIYETPYRLNALLRDLSSTLGKKRKACIAMSLTSPEETFYRGSLKRLTQQFEDTQIKKEFVVIVS